MDELRFVDACTDEHFQAMSLIHALRWRGRSLAGWGPLRILYARAK